MRSHRLFLAPLAFAAAAATAGCGGGGGGSSYAPASVATPALGATAKPTTTPTPVASATSTAAAATSTPAATSSAPGTPVSGSTTGGMQPGPAILYESAASPPQLVNSGIWVAPPILISGASAYRDGEYLYQDYLYDDHGANGTVPDANQTDEMTANLLAKYTGTYTYPTATGYGGNAADLVEFRMKPQTDSTAFRITLNTMIDPTLYAFTIGLGGSTTSYAMPHSANVSEPADIFVTVHGTTGDVVTASTGAVLGAATVTVDQTHRQIQVLVPYSLYDTRNNTALRVAVATGLWDNTNNDYLLPAVASSATAPGGAGTLTSVPAFFNVGFRHAEPAAGSNEAGITTMGTFWRESAQAAALATGNLSTLYDTVDMTKLAAGVDDDMIGEAQGAPASGHIDRILASHFEPFQGREFTGCQGAATACSAEYGSALQPYAVYVPVEAAPPGGYPLTLQEHSLTVNYNQFQNTNNEMQFGERNGGSLVFCTEGRGPDNWYAGLAEADVFEVWADVVRHYPIDQNSVAMTGYSMGGFATWKLGTRWPDLFGAMQPTVGPTFVGTDAVGSGGATDTIAMFPSLRNIPILSWHASADELVQTPFAVDEEQAMANDNLNFEWDLFSPADHLVLTLNDQYAPAATFLGVPKNDVNPPHVTFVVDPGMDNAQYDVVSDHAYWVSNVVERSTSIQTGTVDVLSAGFGLGDPPTSGAQAVVGTLTGGMVAPLAYTGFKDTYGTAPTEPVADKLTITATNVASFTVAPGRAMVDCNAQLNVTTDGALAVTLQGCTGVQNFSKGHTITTPRATIRPGGRRAG